MKERTQSDGISRSSKVSAAPHEIESRALETESRIARVLVAVDLSDRSDNVIRQARRFASSDVEVVVLHVVCDLDVLLGAYVCEKPEQLQSDLSLEGKAQLQRLTEECFSGERRPRELVVTGEPWSQIVETSVRHRADVIVLGAHADERRGHGVLGSTASRVVRHAACPVVVVPSE